MEGTGYPQWSNQHGEYAMIRAICLVLLLSACTTTGEGKFEPKFQPLLTPELKLRQHEILMEMWAREMEHRAVVQVSGRRFRDI